VRYWVDKWLFMRFYRTPPQYSIALGRSMTTFLPVAVLLHLLFAAWMLGNPTIFLSDESFLDALSAQGEQIGLGSVANATATDSPILQQVNRVRQTHVLPFVVLALLLVLVRVVLAWFQSCSSLLEKLFNILTCGRDKRAQLFVGGNGRVRHSPFPAYLDALAQGKISGLPSYNILQNPIYQSMFAISDEFARQHKTIAAVAKSALPEARSVKGVEEERAKRLSQARTASSRV
jgi:hypothetical protein